MKITMKNDKKANQSYDLSPAGVLRKVTEELYEQYQSYPAGNNIRYEIFLGFDDFNIGKHLNYEYDLRLNAVEQLKKEGLILDYIREPRPANSMGPDFTHPSIGHSVAKCLIDKVILIEHYNDLFKAEKISTARKNPAEKTLFPIPEGKSLKDITIKVLSNNNFEISCEDKSEKFFGADLGLLKTKHGKYKEKHCLNFLNVLSANNGIYPLKDLREAERMEVTSRKRELTALLKKVFSTNEDPFLRYNKQKDEHKIRIKLIPQNELQPYSFRDKNIHDPYADLGDLYNNSLA